MGRGRHPTEIRDDIAIGNAVSFAVHFRRGPFEVYRGTAATLAEARGIEATFNAEHGAHGRRAIVYAVTAEGRAIAIPEHMR